MDIERLGQSMTAKSESSNIKGEFVKACITLWDQEIRKELIYHKGLLCCLECLSFFSNQELASTHPKALTTQVNKLCSQNRLNTADAFFQYLWAISCQLSKIFGKI